MRKGVPVVVVYLHDLWIEQKLWVKVKSLVKFSWMPSEKYVLDTAIAIYKRDVLGSENDYASDLLKLIVWHYSRNWKIENITEIDELKASALESLTVLTELRYRTTSELLKINLKTHSPGICFLAYAMVIKVPVTSFQYFLRIDVRFTFNSIRKSKHLHSNEIVDYLYEILTLQQKISLALHEYLSLTEYSNQNKNKSILIHAEIKNIMFADLIFAYLKASIEKIMAMVGFIFNVKNLDSKLKHQQRVKALQQSIDANYLETEYVKFMFEQFSSENLDELNSYRSGILHKRGISDLQPHNYVGKKSTDVPLHKIFQTLKDQHIINTAVLVAALAVLTDKLVEIDKPDLSQDEYEELLNMMTKSSNVVEIP